jgi:hypothetical protein
MIPSPMENSTVVLRIVFILWLPRHAGGAAK